MLCYMRSKIVPNTLPEQESMSQGQNSVNDERNDKSSEVIALDDLSLGTPSNLSKGVKFVEGSVMNYDLVLELGKGCDYIFHQLR